MLALSSRPGLITTSVSSAVAYWFGALISFTLLLASIILLVDAESFACLVISMVVRTAHVRQSLKLVEDSRLHRELCAFGSFVVVCHFCTCIYIMLQKMYNAAVMPSIIVPDVFFTTMLFLARTRGASFEWNSFSGRSTDVADECICTPGCRYEEIMVTTTWKDCSDCRSTCVICLNEFEMSQKVARLHCGHVFHLDCTKSWVDHCTDQFALSTTIRFCPMRCSATIQVPIEP
eukprot:TRINITY_DN21468_c0_g1_i1.p1 TRINITY_DN21468_c0_g1~~TRINITY_DN21468_c0_g1_i1.p1  ORF type:complete len:233 (-),score=13.97 TRINITY_DN21468_c0_g1_i1:636-1334(-)